MGAKNTVTVDGVEYARASSEQLAAPVAGLRYCIVRCKNAGVHAGFVKSHNRTAVTLLQSRRLWRWFGKTLSGLAVEGSFAPEKCKYADEIPEITVLDACEIIPCTPKAIDSIRIQVGRWEND